MHRTRTWVVAFAAMATLIVAAAGSATAMANQHGGGGVQVESYAVSAYYTERIANEGFLATASRTGRQQFTVEIEGLQSGFVMAPDDGSDDVLADVRQRLRIDVKFFDEADALFGRARVSGQTQALLDNGMAWDGTVSGTVACMNARYQDGDDILVRCSKMEFQLEMTGPLLNESGSCRGGEMTLRATGQFNAETNRWRFVSAEGEPGAVGEAVLKVMPGDNVHIEAKRLCFNYQKIEWARSSEVTFSYPHPTLTTDRGGDGPFMGVALGGPDTTTRLRMSEMPVVLTLANPDASDPVWEPVDETRTMMQTVDVEIQRDRRSNRVSLSGTVDVEFGGGVVGSGRVSGGGVCEDGVCNITMIRDIPVEAMNGRVECGSLDLRVSVTFVPGENPTWTFGDDGLGTVTLIENTSCYIESATDGATND